MYNTATIDTLKQLKIEFERLLPLNDRDKKRLDKKLRLEFNYNSNHLEGNTLTYGQTQLLLYFDKSSGDVPVSDLEEMKAHDVALSHIEEMVRDSERHLTETFIKQLNETILVKPFYKDAITQNGERTRKRIEIGQYKSSANSVQLKDGKIHEYASPEETPVKMKELLDWYHDEKDRLHPVQLAAEFHYKFVCIHPFDDGNGRVARLVMNYILLKNNYPPVVIKSEDKENYLTALQKADTGDTQAMIEYIEKQAIWSLEISIKAAKGEDIDELGDIEKEIEILKRQKLSKTKIYKTPKVVYELIHHINDELCATLNGILSMFDDFFAETKNEKYIDDLKVQKTKKITPNVIRTARMFSEREEVVKDFEVFGRNLDEEDILKVEWVKKMLSLKSAKRKIDIEIWCTLELGESDYLFSIIEKNTSTDDFPKNSSTLIEIENNYNTLFMSDTIASIKKTVSNHLIKMIQSVE